MEMSIDEAIEIINHYLDYPQEEVRKALLLAINTMRKYQKIEQIVKVWHQDIYAKDFECISEVAEVVEDGEV